MQKIITLFKKELSFYFDNPIGYIVAILFAVIANFLFVKDLFLRGDSSMRPFFEIAPWLLMVFVPAVGMRAFAEEKRTNTLEILLTLPISPLEIVAAKFLALFSFCAITLGLTLSIPITIAKIGALSVGEVAISYLGLLCVAASFVAVSLFFSTLTKNQIIAFLSSLVALFCLYVFGTDLLASIIPQEVHDTLLFLSPAYQYATFLKGLVDLRSLLYFLSFTLVFLFLSIVDLERKG